MTRSQLVAAAILTAQAMIQFALVTQTDVTIPPPVKFTLGIVAVGLSTIALFLKLQPPGPVIAVPGGAKPVGGE